MVFLSGLLWALFVNGSGGKEISGELRWGPQPCALQTPQVHLDLEGGNRLEAAFITPGEGGFAGQQEDSGWGSTETQFSRKGGCGHFGL